MDNAPLLVMIAVLILAAASRGLVRALRNPSPGGAVLITSMAFLSGAAILVLRGGTSAVVEILRICCAFLPLYLLGYFGSQKLLGLAADLPTHCVPKVDASRAGVVAAWLFFLSMASIVVVAVYFSGTDKILAGLYSFLFAGDTDISIMELRLGFSTGEDGYFAPGYIKQFRDILLPLSTFLLLFSIPRSPRRLMLLFLLIVPAVAVLIISSGERGPVLAFILGTVYVALLSVSLGVSSRRTIVVPLLIVAAVGGTIFAALTSTYTNRSYDDASAGAILLDRVVTTVPAENSASFYVWQRGAPAPGAGWLGELSTILPGKKIVLSNLLHEELGGGDKGNSVLGMWMDVYFNFGWAIGAIVSLLMGIVLAAYSHWVTMLRSRSAGAAICGLWIAITMLNVYSPFGFVLYGPFALTVVLVVLARRTKVRRADWRIEASVANR
jgi:oligosaccharide repeat unit polymerase